MLNAKLVFFFALTALVATQDLYFPACNSVANPTEKHQCNDGFEEHGYECCLVMSKAKNECRKVPSNMVRYLMRNNYPQYHFSCKAETVFFTLMAFISLILV